MYVSKAIAVIAIIVAWLWQHLLQYDNAWGHAEKLENLFLAVLLAVAVTIRPPKRSHASIQLGFVAHACPQFIQKQSYFRWQ